LWWLLCGGRRLVWIAFDGIVEVVRGILFFGNDNDDDDDDNNNDDDDDDGKKEERILLLPLLFLARLVFKVVVLIQFLFLRL